MFLTTQLHKDKFTASHCDLIFVHGIHPIGGYFCPNIRLYNLNLFIILQPYQVPVTLGLRVGLLSAR